MGTIDPIAAALFGRTRIRLLTAFLEHPDRQFYLRELIRLSSVGQGGVQRELARLCKAGIIRRTRIGVQAFFQANRECPVFAELSGLVMKTTGAIGLLRRKISSLPGIELSFVFGSVARGEQKSGSDLDLLVVGKIGFSELVAELASVQAAIGRDLNPTVYGVKEFRAKLAAGDHFLTAVMREPKIFLTGSNVELAAMAGQRVA